MILKKYKDDAKLELAITFRKLKVPFWPGPGQKIHVVRSNFKNLITLSEAIYGRVAGQWCRFFKNLKITKFDENSSKRWIFARETSLEMCPCKSFFAREIFEKAEIFEFPIYPENTWAKALKSTKSRFLPLPWNHDLTRPRKILPFSSLFRGRGRVNHFYEGWTSSLSRRVSSDPKTPLPRKNGSKPPKNRKITLFRVIFTGGGSSRPKRALLGPFGRKNLPILNPELTCPVKWSQKMSQIYENP